MPTSLSSTRLFSGLILGGAIFLAACAAKSPDSGFHNDTGNGGSGGGSKSSGGSSDMSSPSSSGGSSNENSSSSKAGAGGGSASSSSSVQAGSSSAGSSSSSSNNSGGGGSGGSAGKSSGGSSASGGSGAASSSSSSNTANTCTQDSQCNNGHCVNNACVCWDSNAKVCNGVCTDVKYNNNACGDCGKTCPPSAPRCDYGNCKCDSPPCAGGGAGGSSSSSSSAGGGGAGNGGSSSSSASSGGAGASGGSSSSSTSNGGTVSVPPITNGSDGWASRYWDCCKPSCGWSENAGGKPVASCSQDNSKMSDAKAQSACQGGSAYVCWDLAPWSVSDNLAYAYVAFNGASCGTCFQIQFDGGTHNGKADSCKALSGKTMFVQVINVGGIGSGQFDVMIPGGGVGDFDACTKQWGSSDLGARYGGFLSACNGDKSCVQDKCNTVFGSKPTLKAACNWFVDWYGAADNPTLKYQKVNCPSELSAKSGM